MHIKNIESYENFQEYLDKYEYIIVNISAVWCKPCLAIKPLMEKYINIINEDEFIYLKIDYSVYEIDDRFEQYFHMKKIPYFGMISKKELLQIIVSGDFGTVSKRIYDFIKLIKKSNVNILGDEKEEFKNDDF
jgi:thiol-disulfide isomerase/thioredoxin